MSFFSGSVVTVVPTMTKGMPEAVMAVPMMPETMMSVVPKINRCIEPITVAMPMPTTPNAVLPPTTVVPSVAYLDDHLAGCRNRVLHTCRHRRYRRAQR